MNWRRNFYLRKIIIIETFMNSIQRHARQVRAQLAIAAIHLQPAGRHGSLQTSRAFHFRFDRPDFVDKNERGHCVAKKQNEERSLQHSQIQWLQFRFIAVE